NEQRQQTDRFTSHLASSERGDEPRNHTKRARNGLSAHLRVASCDARGSTLVSSCLPSAPAAPEQDRLDRLEQDHGIKYQALILDVVEIVLQLLPRVFDGRTVRVFDLRPAGQTGRDQMALLVERNLLSELFDEVRPFRPGADEVHLAL